MRSSHTSFLQPNSQQELTQVREALSRAPALTPAGFLRQDTKTSQEATAIPMASSGPAMDMGPLGHYRMKRDGVRLQH